MREVMLYAGMRHLQLLRFLKAVRNDMDGVILFAEVIQHMRGVREKGRFGRQHFQEARTEVMARLGVAEQGHQAALVDNLIRIAHALDVPLGPEPTPVAPRLHAQEIDLYYSMEKYWSNLRQLMLSVFRWQGVEQIVTVTADSLIRSPHRMLWSDQRTLLAGR